MKLKRKKEKKENDLRLNVGERSEDQRVAAKRCWPLSALISMPGIPPGGVRAKVNCSTRTGVEGGWSGGEETTPPPAQSFLLGDVTPLHLDSSARPPLLRTETQLQMFARE